MKKLILSIMLMGLFLSAFSQAPNEVLFMGIYLDTTSGDMRPVRFYQEQREVVVNQLPTANAGTDKNLAYNATGTTLTGSGSDPDGEITSYHWTQVAGTTATIGTPTAATTTVSGLSAGNSYTFRLTVTDDSSATDADDVIVSVDANLPPNAVAGGDQTITLPTNSVTLSGSATDPDGTVASTVWSKVSGGAATITNPNNLSTTVTGLVEGAYQFRLTVTDDYGTTDVDVMNVTVNAAAGLTEVVKFNLGPAGTNPISGYTGVYGDPRGAVLTATANGVTISTIQNYPLWSAGPFTFSAGNTGHSTGSNSGTRPDSVWVGNFFRYNQTFTDTATSKCFLISGLTPGATYVVKTGGSRELSGTTDPAQLGSCEFRVMGVAQTLNTDNNTTNILKFDNVVADSNGCISMFVGQISGTTHYGFISFIEIYTP